MFHILYDRSIIHLCRELLILVDSLLLANVIVSINKWWSIKQHGGKYVSKKYSDNLTIIYHTLGKDCVYMLWAVDALKIYLLLWILFYDLDWWKINSKSSTLETWLVRWLVETLVSLLMAKGLNVQ